jgi:hypothetical protein
MLPNLASQMRVAFASMAWNTGSSSPGELLITPSTSAVAVCRSNDWLSSRVRACTSSNSRTFSIVITRLACESCQQCNLLVREWPHLGATDRERADGLVLPQQGNAESGPVTETERALAAIGELIGGTLEVVHVHRFPINEGAPRDPAALDRPLAQN